MIAHVGERDAGGNAAGAGERGQQGRLAHAIAVPRGQDAAGPVDLQVLEIAPLVGQVTHEPVDRPRRLGSLVVRHDFTIDLPGVRAAGRRWAR